MQTLERDGVALRYEWAQGTETAVILVHGWCCDHSYFAPQFDFLSGRGHTVVAVDLRGHGESDKPEQSYSMDVFADDLAWLSSELGLERPVVVGHSMGGVIAFELAVTHPGLPGAIVMIDSPVARPAASRDGMPAFLEKLNGPEYREALTGYVADVLFLPTDEVERRAEILARMPETDRHVMISAFEGMRDFDPDEARGPIGVPTLFIAADDRPLSDLPHLFQLAPDMLFGQTVGSGHFCTLEVPDQVNSMLARFLAVLPSLGDGSAQTPT
jgi:pimeloyl-ACP methyl ester carboxylesterase